LPRFLRRDAGAEVERLYRKHAADVLRYALLVLRSRSDAEDVTQAVFMRALGALERGEKVRTPRNWLIKIAHNECRRLISSRKLHVELPEQLAAEPEEPGQAEELRRAMAGLPPAQRQALVLRELEGRSYNEIAAALSLSVSAVETLIFRARRSLREQLEGAMSCEEFAGLLDDPDARARVRAHTRICAACATLERQARGRKSALRRIASSLGLPWWGAKLAAVALTTATVAGVATVVPRDHANQHPTPTPTPVPRSVRAPVSLIPRGTGVTSFTARPHPAVAKLKVSGTRPVPGTSAAPTRAGVHARPAAAPAVLPAPSPSPAGAAPAASAPPAAAPTPAKSVVELPAAVAALEQPPLPVAVPPAPPLPVAVPALPAVPAAPAVPAPAISPVPLVTEVPEPAPEPAKPPVLNVPVPNVSTP
jgi:RNA polymerase sigma factor (sigma-70 family)